MTDFRLHLTHIKFLYHKYQEVKVHFDCYLTNVIEVQLFEWIFIQSMSRSRQDVKDLRSKDLGYGFNSLLVVTCGSVGQSPHCILPLNIMAPLYCTQTFLKIKSETPLKLILGVIRTHNLLIFEEAPKPSCLGAQQEDSYLLTLSL